MKSISQYMNKYFPLSFMYWLIYINERHKYSGRAP